ncbi:MULTISPECIES: ATP-binding protein [unclassified Moorena]|uniref:AAA family ATPase n=1 Tax=unclassified Moorena TaxID=2683338 RepID=UPI0013FEB02C|nr:MULTISPECIES: ATP-binding protein [unclassified Moorena]NEO16056.1 ATP-binding protein [Moorena sp. SIO3E8]NEP98243.1 ATP-binding protein [Moorena sp. SIO3F7]
MLVEFSVENYRSFKERQTLSMVASKKKTGRNSNSFPMPNVKSLRLLTSAVVYGPNASGKSNLVRAMQTMRQIVLQSATGMQLGSRWNIEPFRLNADCQNKPSCFEIIFIQDNIRYQYGFSLDQERVYEEWLIAYPKGRAQTWFERNYCSEEQEYDWYFGRGLKGEKERIKGFVRSNSLFISHAAQNNHIQLGKLFTWFRYKLKLIPASLDYLYKFTALKCAKDKNFLEKIFKLIKGADIGISTLDIEQQTIDDYVKKVPDEIQEDLKNNLNKIIKTIDKNRINDNSSELESVITYPQVLALYKMNDSDQTIAFELEDESDGTQRLFEMGGYWIDALDNGEILIIDELDRSLNSELSTYLIKEFNDKTANQNNAQLIVTTHDTTFLDREIFNQDQVWLMQKDSNNSTKLYSLLDFKIREDESLQKGYLKGRYGAIPFISGLDS